MEKRIGHFLISDDRDIVGLEALELLLRQTYWASGRSREKIRKTVENSLCFSVHDGDRMIGFGRVVSDCAEYSMIFDLIIDTDYRGMGIGKSLMNFITDHPDLKGTSFLLWTEDAEKFYEPLGFREEPKFMFLFKRP